MVTAEKCILCGPGAASKRMELAAAHVLSFHALRTHHVEHGMDAQRAFRLTGNLSQVKIKEVIQSSFRPEFINRIDDIIAFNKLEAENLRVITINQLNLLSQRIYKDMN